jgi:hypothetical protein
MNPEVAFVLDVENGRLTFQKDEEDHQALPSAE